MFNLLIGIMIGIVWYPSIMAFIELMSTKTLDEYEKLVKRFGESRIENKIGLIIVFTIRIPVLLAIIIPISIHVIKLANKESK